MAGVSVVRRREPAAPAARPSPALAPWPRQIVALAASTGGPVALQVILSALPADLDVPILVVQHITAGFVRSLADWLGQCTPLRVKVAEAGESLTAGTVYLAPEDHHLGVLGPRIRLSPDPPVRGFRPAATALFESVGRAFGRSALAVILTGMGDDGVAGLRELRKAGGHVLAQDELSCVVYGMPGAAVAAGVVDEVVPLEVIAGRLVRQGKVQRKGAP
jgi:two-component system chemotaxis response regulator CheB